MNAAVEIAQFYGFERFNYQAKPANIAVGTNPTEAWIKTWAKDDEMLITLHYWYANKDCPGPYFIRQIPWIVRELNKRLAGQKAEAFIGEGTAGGKVEYLITITASSLNIRSGPGVQNKVVKTLINDRNTYTIVEEARLSDGSTWGRLKSGVGWLNLAFTSKR
jgi:hypothetical protein